jgi:hypothetical protein
VDDPLKLFFYLKYFKTFLAALFIGAGGAIFAISIMSFSIIINMPEVLLVGRAIAALSDGMSYCALVVFVQVSIT